MKKALFSAALITLTALLGACTLKLTPMSDDNPTQQPTEAVSQTPILGAAEITEEIAVKWAEAHDASELFVDLAQYYWKYGEETGIRPEVMYAQAALETAYGNFGGRVTPDMNNFAGIKKVDAVSDATEDHEAFPTAEDGVRAHYNHMCAYTGLDPIGIPHNRYYLVLSSDWAGTIRYVEELGGHWCPDADYGNKIVNTFLSDMYNY
ncbi:MAG: glucosaminidase domain-containing protein [Candidatus Ornithomonoglobus sp.]